MSTCHYNNQFSKEKVGCPRDPTGHIGALSGPISKTGRTQSYRCCTLTWGGLEHETPAQAVWRPFLLKGRLSSLPSCFYASHSRLPPLGKLLMPGPRNVNFMSNGWRHPGSHRRDQGSPRLSKTEDKNALNCEVSKEKEKGVPLSKCRNLRNFTCL